MAPGVGVAVSRASALRDYARELPSGPGAPGPTRLVLVRAEGLRHSLLLPYHRYIPCWAVIVPYSIPNTFPSLDGNQAGDTWTVVLVSAVDGRSQTGFTGGARQS